MKRVLELYDAFQDRLGRLLGWLVVAMVLIAAYNTIARYLGAELQLNLSSNALIELQWFLFSLIFLLGGAYCLRQDKHVRVDLFYRRFGPRGKAVINLLGTLLLLLPFCGLMLYHAWLFAERSIRAGEMSPDPDGLPYYLIKAVIPLAFILILFEALVLITHALRVLRGQEKPPVSEEDHSAE